MAGRYPDYDWRGIAMLTQQLGQLFEPSKAKMMSQQQDHEMNMLMAKQSWKMQSDDLDALKLKRKGLLVQLDAQTTAVNELGLRDLVNAGKSDGANVGEAAEMFEKNDIRKLSDIQDADSMHRDAIRELENNLSYMKTLNEEAKIGQAWRKGSMTKKDQKGAMIDYYEAANQDKIAGLSYEEGQNAIKKYITDNYSVAEGEQGMEMDFGTGGKPDIIMVRPEAIAFKSGWDSGTGTGTGRGKAEKGEISDRQSIKDAQNNLLGGKTHLKMTNEELIKSVVYNKDLYEGIDNRMKGSEYPLGLSMELAGTGDFLATEVAYQQGTEYGIDRSTIHQYSAAYTNYNQGMKEMLKRQISLPGKVTQTSGILTQMQVPNDQAIQIMQDFNTYNSNPDTLLTQINTYEPSDATGAPKEQLHQAYIDFLKQLPTMDPQKRREGIQQFTNILSR
jgi:hypothetical protein